MRHKAFSVVVVGALLALTLGAAALPPVVVGQGPSESKATMSLSEALAELRQAAGPEASKPAGWVVAAVPFTEKAPQEAAGAIEASLIVGPPVSFKKVSWARVQAGRQVDSPGGGLRVESGRLSLSLPLSTGSTHVLKIGVANLEERDQEVRLRVTAPSGLRVWASDMDSWPGTDVGWVAPLEPNKWLMRVRGGASGETEDLKVRLQAGEGLAAGSYSLRIELE